MVCALSRKRKHNEYLLKRNIKTGYSYPMKTELYPWWL
ncbi:hypothetical protein JCM19297_262 [Nonlabens ulvanivorans]|nr:hypothetical protein JCM19297_262 [Nonlabens ulvanivorans]